MLKRPAANPLITSLVAAAAMAAAMSAAASPAAAAQRHAGRRAAPTVRTAAARPHQQGAAGGWGTPGAIVLDATRRSQGDPGVTLELAPDAKETATGGPVGGPPGFDGS